MICVLLLNNVQGFEGFIEYEDPALLEWEE